MKNQNSLSFPDAYQFFNNSFGHVVPFEMIRADPGSYSSVFCEGSVALRELLCDLWENGVETRGCCKGHECVHYYIKDSIFGGRKYIDEQTYRAHARSKRYHDIETEAHAYLAFRPDNLGASQEICNKIEMRMKELLPELTYATNAFPDLITIGLDKYIPKQQREQFFSTLSFVLHRDFFHDIEALNENSVKTKKPSLDIKIKSASLRATEFHSNDKISTKEVDPER